MAPTPRWLLQQTIGSRSPSSTQRTDGNSKRRLQQNVDSQYLLKSFDFTFLHCTHIKQDHHLLTQAFILLLPAASTINTRIRKASHRLCDRNSSRLFSSSTSKHTLFTHIFTMEFSQGDNQNSAPGSVQAAKLNGSRKGPDSQSTTKRYVFEHRHDSDHKNPQGAQLTGEPHPGCRLSLCSS